MTITKEFTDELTQLLNRHSIDNHCNTPDYILAGHITLTIMGVQALNVDRDKWMGIGKDTSDYVDSPMPTGDEVIKNVYPD